MAAFYKDLLARRVPQILGIYLAAGWGVLEFTDYIVSRYILSNHLTDLALMAWGLMIPTVIMLAYFHGRPGRDEWSKVEKFGVPINIVLAVALLIPTFAGKDLGAATRAITVEDEAGQLVERVVPKSEFRKRIALFYFENTSADTTLDWLQHGIPLAIQDDLLQDMFMVVRSSWPYFSERLKEVGYPSGVGVPFALRREIAEELHVNRMVSGTISGSADSLSVTVTLNDVSRGKLLTERSFTGSDPLELADRIALQLKRDLEIPGGHIDEVRDLPAAELLTGSLPAFKAYVDGWRALEAGEWQGASRGFATAVEIDPTYANANLMLYVASLFLNDAPRGAQALEAAIQHSYKMPERLQFTLRAAYYRFVKQDPAKTLATAGTHAELFPDDVSAHQMLLVLYSQAGEWEKAIAAAQRVLDLDPDDYDMLRLIGQLYTQQGAYDQAREYYERYANKLPEDPRAFADLGDLSQTVGELERALEYYDRALVLDPSNTEVLTNVARTETALGRFAAAEQQLEEARNQAATPTQEFQALNALRRYNVRRGQLRRATDLMQQSWTALDAAQPPLVAAQVKLTQLGTYVRAGRADVATAVLDDIRAQLSPPFDMLAAIGQLTIAQETKDAESLEASLAELERLIGTLGLAALRPAITLGRGRLLEIRGDCEQAIIAFKRTLELQPADADVNTDIGRCYRQLGNSEMAERHLLQTTARDPFDPLANLELARVYNQAGQPQKAREHLQKSLEVWLNADPEYGPAREARQLFAKLGSSS